MQTVNKITDKRLDTMSIVELENARQECLRNGQRGREQVLRHEIGRRVARNEFNHERLRAALAR